MIFSSSLLEKAVNELAKLPGIGKKTALRLALHLLKQPENEVSHFCEAIENMRREIQFCSRCFNISVKQICNIFVNIFRKQDI